MNKTFFTTLIFATLTVVAVADTKPHQPQEPGFEMMMLAPAPRPLFMPDGLMPPRAMFGMGQNGPRIDLTDDQREKLRDLGKKHHKEIKQLDDARAELHERYQEKFEAVLTDEQFRKIEKMRKYLRREMKKLDEKQRSLFEKHRGDFESILTPQQRKQLHPAHDNK